MEPLKFLSKTSKSFRIALLILNCPVETLQSKIEVLWPKAVLKVATDGAVEKLKTLNLAGRTFVPDLICGDFDSAEKSTLEHFRLLGSKILHTPEQDATDFTKALGQIIANNVIEYDEIVVLGGTFESRVDHIFGNFHTLFKAMHLTNKNVYLYMDDSVNMVLKPGKHAIHVNTGLEGDWCGIIPLGSPCRNITTTGLKWNLKDGSLDFCNGMISTSNTWDGSPIITIDNSDPVLWTMGIKTT